MNSLVPPFAALSLAFLAFQPAAAASPASGIDGAAVTKVRWCGDTPESCAKQRPERLKGWQPMSPEERQAKRQEAQAKWEAMPEADKALLRTHMEQRLASMPEERRAHILEWLKSKEAEGKAKPVAN